MENWFSIKLTIATQRYMWASVLFGFIAILGSRFIQPMLVPGAGHCSWHRLTIEMPPTFALTRPLSHAVMPRSTLYHLSSHVFAQSLRVSECTELMVSLQLILHDMV